LIERCKGSFSSPGNLGDAAYRLDALRNQCETDPVSAVADHSIVQPRNVSLRRASLGFGLALGAIALIGGSCGRSRSVGSAGAGGLGASAGVDAAVDDASAGAVQDAAAGEPSVSDASSGGDSASHGGAPSVSFASTRPVWGDSLSTSVCTVQRLANPSELQAFQWVPCEGIDGCEEAVLNTRVFNSKNSDLLLMPRGSTSDDEQTVVGLPGPPGILATDSGQVLDGYAVANESANCRLLSVSLWRARFGVTFADFSANTYSGLLGTLGSTEKPIATALAPMTTGGPESDRLGDERWVWDWNLPSRDFSVSAEDASDFRQFAGPSDTVVDMGHSVSAGSQFLLDTELADPKQNPSLSSFGIMQSDGVSAPTPYVVPTDGSSTNAIGFAHSYVAWQRGVNASATDVFQTVELWASPYDPDPNKLKPTMITDLGWHHFDGGYGGYGHYVVPAIDVEKNILTGMVIWNLKTKTKRTYALPSDFKWGYPIGVTQKYFWVINRAPHFLRRYLLD